METPWKYIFSESSGGEEYDKLLTWSEKYSRDMRTFFEKLPSLLNEIAQTDFMESWREHSVTQKVDKKKTCPRFFYFPFRSKVELRGASNEIVTMALCDMMSTRWRRSFTIFALGVSTRVLGAKHAPLIKILGLQFLNSSSLTFLAKTLDRKSNFLKRWR